MEEKDPIGLLREIRRLLALKDENPFKIRAMENAAHNLADIGYTDLEERAKAGTLREIPGIGKGIEEILTEYLVHGKSTIRDELYHSLPAGLVELTALPGIGPKKAMTLIKELGVRSIAELEYACRENRLTKLKGFGEKMQSQILEAIRFENSHAGLQRLCDASVLAEEWVSLAKKEYPNIQLSETGALRRKLEVLDRLEFLVALPTAMHAKESEWKNSIQNLKVDKGRQALPIHVHFAKSDEYAYELARTTATVEHWTRIGEPKPVRVESEEKFYEHLGLPWIPPEARETGEEVALARSGKLKDLLPLNGVRGIFHSHTTRSDGVNTLEQMVAAAQKLGFQYIGISDHSQSAFYAQGLKITALKAQEKEIREIQEKYPEIRIFWGIESDILATGALDYDTAVLKRFDFVIASIHSRLQMDRKEMTDRILKAIKNPYTRFIGHVTGRLLLGRKGADLDMEKIIEEAAKHDVAIELNSHPSRLDIDWRWGRAMRECGTLTSINPDAHEVAGLEDIQYGIAMARKALLPSKQVINSKPLKEVEKWLKRE